MLLASVGWFITYQQSTIRNALLLLLASCLFVVAGKLSVCCCWQVCLFVAVGKLSVCCCSYFIASLKVGYIVSCFIFFFILTVKYTSISFYVFYVLFSR